MNIHNKKRIISVLLTLTLVVLMTVPTMSMEVSQPTVNLGTTSSFAVLAGSTITNTGTTTINGDAGGDVGLYPGTAFTGEASTTVSGTTHITDAAALLAKNDLVIAYDDAAGRTPVTTIPSELGGTTLTPGTYDSIDGTFQITGTLTLDAQGDSEGVFVFKTASTLITASGSNINLINSARYCRTFWKVGSSATLGTTSHFVGHIFALESITANTGATVQGQLLARNGAVTLDNNTITNGFCEIAPPSVPIPVPATLSVIKHVINDNGGTAVAADFNLHVKMEDIDVTASPAPGVELPGTTYTLAAGTYKISEDVFAGYDASYSGDSDSSGNITLAAGENKTVTITNNDIPAVVVTETVKGGQLPKTSAHVYELLFGGVILMLVGAVGWRSRKIFE
ncbi:MAG: ice-binding family protein [Lutisporaceae bacterium]